MRVRHTLLILLFAGTMAAFLHREQRRESFEQPWLDPAHRRFLHQNTHAAAPATPQSVLARLDDVDQANRVFASWPLSGPDWQVILQNLLGYAPRSIALDIPMSAEPVGDGLSAALTALPSLTIAVTASATGEPTLWTGTLPTFKTSGDISAIPEFKNLLPQQWHAEQGIGYIDLSPQSARLSLEGDVCRIPLLARQGDKVVPTLALRALLQWLKIDPASVDVTPNIAIKAGTTLAIPIDSAGFFRLFLPLAPHPTSLNADTFVLTKDQALANTPAQSPLANDIQATEGSLLWFGHDDIAARRFRMPNGTPVSTAELTVRALAAIQSGSFLHPLPRREQLSLLLGALLFGTFISLLPRRYGLPLAFIGATGLIYGSFHAFKLDSTWIPLVPSIGTLGASVIANILLPRRSRRASKSKPKPLHIPPPAYPTLHSTPEPILEPALGVDKKLNIESLPESPIVASTPVAHDITPPSPTVSKLPI